MNKCEMYGRQFISRIGEPYCEECAKEFEEQGDISALTDIIANRGVEWIEDVMAQQVSSCFECGKKSAIKVMSRKKVYEGTDFKEDSPINYPTALVCRNCR